MAEVQPVFWRNASISVHQYTEGTPQILRFFFGWTYFFGSLFFFLPFWGIPRWLAGLSIKGWKSPKWFHSFGGPKFERLLLAYMRNVWENELVHVPIVKRLMIDSRTSISPRPFDMSKIAFSVQHSKIHFVAYWLIHVPFASERKGARNQKRHETCSQETQPIVAKKGDLNAWEIQPKRFFSGLFFGFAWLDTRKNCRTSMIFKYISAL